MKKGKSAVKKGKLLLLVLAAGLIAAFFLFDLKQYFDLAYLKSQQDAIQGVYATRPLLAAGVFLPPVVP